MRTAAAAALWSMLSSGALTGPDLKACLGDIPLAKLAEDSSEKVRSFALKSYRSVLLACGGDLDPGVMVGLYSGTPLDNFAKINTE